LRFFVVMLFVVGALPRGGQAADPPVSLSLASGQAVFWKGGYVADGKTSPAFTWPLKLAAEAARLRVAIDTPSREDSFLVELLAPDGSVAASASNSNQFNAEAFVTKPGAGAWSVRVTPQTVTDANFRMRAKLESVVPPMPAGKVAMLPNLRAVPPFEFGFIAPANPLNGVYPPDTVNPPLDVAGIHPLSWAPDEVAPHELGGAAARNCLRLTSGPINVGSGPFDMRFDLAGDLLAGKAKPQPTNLTNTVTGPMQQAVHYSDGSAVLRPAGQYSFHTTHGHFHTDNILTYELYSVVDAAKGTLHAEGVGTKSGFCPADQLFGQWRSFTQRAPGTFGEGDSATGGNCFSPSKGGLGLTVGWGDVYRWQRPGQFVEFPGTDGLYVVRTVVDKANNIVEENENDNTSYAYLRITGEKIDELERGQGLDPWDANKLVFRGVGPASADNIGGELDVAAAAAATPVVSAAATTAPATLPATGGRNVWWPAAGVLTAAMAVNAVRRRTPPARR
jgi:hypothetical protein